MDRGFNLDINTGLYTVDLSKVTAYKAANQKRWTCPYKTGHQLPVKLMLLPSA